MRKVPDLLFGMVQTAIGEQFMCYHCAEGADQPLTPDGQVITRRNILDDELEFQCERCGVHIGDQIIIKFESEYSAPEFDERTMPEPDVERWMEETAAQQYADHVAELKERERLDS